MKVTKKEYEFLKELEEDYNTQEGEDGRVCGYVTDCNGDMKSTRGVVGSLVKKGVVWIQLEIEGCIHPITKKKESDVFMVGVFEDFGSNYKLKNLEVV